MADKRRVVDRDRVLRLLSTKTTVNGEKDYAYSLVDVARMANTTSANVYAIWDRSNSKRTSGDNKRVGDREKGKTMQRTRAGEKTLVAHKAITETALGSMDITAQLRKIDLANGGLRHPATYSSAIARARERAGIRRVPKTTAQREEAVRQELIGIIKGLRNRKKSVNMTNILATERHYVPDRLARKLFAELLFTNEGRIFDDQSNLAQVEKRTGLRRKEALEVRKQAQERITLVRERERRNKASAFKRID